MTKIRGRSPEQRSRRNDWAKLSEGTYILRCNIHDWTDEELWKTYILRGSNTAIKATLTKENSPRSQNIVESSAITKSRPTTEVETVFDTS